MVARKSAAKAAPKPTPPAEDAPIIEREDGATVPNDKEGIPVLEAKDELDTEAIAAIEAAADEQLPEPPEQEFVHVTLGSESHDFLKGHALSVADLLDALDGRTERVYTTKTHILTRYNEYGVPTHFHDPEQIVTLENGDTFRADLRLLG